MTNAVIEPKPPDTKRSWQELSWSEKLTRVSVAAASVAAIAGAAVAVKDDLRAIFTNSPANNSAALEEHPDPAPEPAQVPKEATISGAGGADSGQDPVGTDVPAIGETLTRRRRSLTRRSANGVTETTEAETVETVTLECASGWVFRDGRCRYELPRPGVPSPGGPIEPSPGPLVVFFDWNDADVSQQALNIVGDVAVAYQLSGGGNVLLSGHADRSGPSDYNQAISARRAQRIREVLTVHGVPEEAIMTHAFGESRPLVQTADGVREPQNRRVEINFTPAERP